VTLFRARTRPLFRHHGRDLGWKALAGGGLDIVTIPGNHETILQEPNVRILADCLLTHLCKAHGEPGATPAEKNARKPEGARHKSSCCGSVGPQRSEGA
jgi:hypothetical protein